MLLKDGSFYMSAFLTVIAYHQDQSTTKIDGLPSRILFSALCYGLQMQMEKQTHRGFAIYLFHS